MLGTISASKQKIGRASGGHVADSPAVTEVIKSQDDEVGIDASLAVARAFEGETCQASSDCLTPCQPGSVSNSWHFLGQADNAQSTGPQHGAPVDTPTGAHLDDFTQPSGRHDLRVSTTCRIRL